MYKLLSMIATLLLMSLGVFAQFSAPVVIGRIVQVSTNPEIKLCKLKNLKGPCVTIVVTKNLRYSRW